MRGYLLYAQIPGTVPQAHPRFDLVPDSVIDQQDLQELVRNIMGRRFGDADLDVDIDIVDVNTVAIHFDPLGLNPSNGWAEGNFDGDNDVDIRDFNQIVSNFAAGGYSIQRHSPTVSAAAAAASDANASSSEVADSPIQTAATEKATADSGTISLAGDDQPSDVDDVQRAEAVARTRSSIFVTAGEPVFKPTVSISPSAVAVRDMGQTYKRARNTDTVLSDGNGWARVTHAHPAAFTRQVW